MNVSTSKKGDLSAILTVKISQADYSEKVENKLKDYRKNASIPGFRPGKVPAGLVRKQYGKSLLIDEVNTILQDAVYTHIKEEDLDILGNPLPIEQTDIDWDNEKDFSFEFELGLSPVFDLAVDKKIKVPYLKIVADKKMVDKYVEDYAKRYGKMSQPETIVDDSILKAQFVEVDKKGQEVEGGINAAASIATDSIEDKKTMKSLLGSKIGDKLTIDVSKVFKDGFNLSNLLSVEAVELESSTNLFEIEIQEISKIEAAELNQELFDKIFGEGAVDSEEAFREKIKADAEQMFIGESKRKFYDDIKAIVLKKTKFDLPKEFLTKWIQTAGEKPMTKEEAEKQYPEMEESMKWQLIENKVLKENDLQVTHEELKDFTKAMVAQQMAQYGQSPQEEELESIAARVLENGEEAQRMSDQVFSDKLLNFFMENVKLEEKEVSFDDFVKSLK